MKNHIFVNLSNHPSDKWDINQVESAEKYGKIVDFPFPQVESGASEDEIEVLAKKITREVLVLNPSAVMCQGEFTLCYAIIRKLINEGVTVLAGCTERIAVEEGNVKTSVFRFVGFRQYR